MIYLPPFAKEGDDDGGGIKWRENQFAHRRAAPVHQRGWGFAACNSNSIHPADHIQPTMYQVRTQVLKNLQYI